jgi:hypothetical protein
MTGIGVLIFMGLLLYGICQAIKKSAPDDGSPQRSQNYALRMES